MKQGCRFGIMVGLLAALPVIAQAPSPAERERIQTESGAERSRELALLGIRETRPTLSARDPAAPNFANFDEARANPFPDLPALLRTNGGKDVTTPSAWTRVRRPEIERLLSDALYGHVPAHLPSVNWRILARETETVDNARVIVTRLAGHVADRADPKRSIDISMNILVPERSRGRHVPAVMLFGSTAPRPPGPPPFQISEPAGPDERSQILGRGWAVVVLDPASVQADNGAGLSAGIIGIGNHGRPRGLDDWGALRAWAWGANRGLDRLTQDPDIDPRRVAIYGHSRYGKAALVAMAYDQRFATGYISSSGAGGAALYRRNYGEGIPNLASSGGFHWFAGNFLRYAAVGRSAADLPVDSHELIALVAPRPVFIGTGVLMLSPPDAVPGDGWVDPAGMFKAAVAASPAWALLGAQGLESDQMPKLGTLLDRGSIAFRQHEYGHTPKPNWPYFLRFAARAFKEPEVTE